MDLRSIIRRRGAHQPATGRSEAQVALDVARYKYLLRVSSPHVFELVHTEVFAQLPVATREAVYRDLCRDLPEELRPTSPDPVELARAAACAQDDDPVYLIRVFRRPDADHGRSPGPSSRRRAQATTYAASVLEAAARTAAASPAGAETLCGFDTSMEAAQVDPTHSVPRVRGAQNSAPPGDWLP